MIEHCIATIERIIGAERNDRRSLLQLGYNLGRLSELTGLGREPFWDEWKDPVENWDLVTLQTLARNLPSFLQARPIAEGESTDLSEPSRP